MDDNKLWYESKTIWGGLVALAAAVAGLVGFNLDPQAHADLAAAIPNVVAAVGAVISILGRLDARSRIG
ncbi:hypothetical protein [Aureimonas psammosilenae]|uniref:hypothetical protein n=1 Tax=Aureimonas psammosilenae TaxID=2495496 RepID=UPI001260E02E|nr:hypothetical protein [Aureimonas psammosilenae]